MTDKMTVNLREIVLDILLELEKNDSLSHLVLGNALKKYQYLDKSQRKFISRLTNGTIEKKIEEDYIINAFSKIKVNKMKPLIRNLLELSVYQLKYMDSVPASAVCNEAVKLAAKRGFGGLRGFVNGVLRSVASGLEELPYPDPEKNLSEYLSVTYSVPEWIIKQWQDSYDTQTVTAMLKAFNENKKTYIRCNTAKVTPAQLKQHLLDENVQVKEIPGLPYAFEISDYDYMNDLECFVNGEFEVQDKSSMLAGEAAGVKDGDFIIDVCAAPGGKSINVALMAEHVSVEARDLSEYKTSMIQENIDRLGLTNINVSAHDATVMDEQMRGKADIVIADLPCSGLGIMGRKPDIRYRVSQESMKELAQLQRKILTVVSEYVKPGGKLIYSTCTINKEENEENVKWFLDHFPSFTLTDVSEAISPCVKGVAQNSTVQLLPGIHDTDGFFVVSIKRNEV